MILGAIEAGGTKFVCGIGNEDGEVLERISIPTTTPEETMRLVVDYFKEKKVDALGVGSFGPVDLDVSSPTYGYITSTPKKHWNQYDLVGKLKNHFHVPIGFDTDVNAAALGESLWGAAKSLDSCLYMTVGTGIGVGAVSEGKLVHGMLHPEMGHILVRRHGDDHFAGRCPFHGDCLEGMASGPAIEARWGKKGIELASDSSVWELEAYYLAQALVNYILVLSPKRIVIGGGVMKQEHVYPLVRKWVIQLLNGYIQHKNVEGHIDTYIVPPVLGDNAGLCGALALARQAYANK
ncbi:ROK family protein [Fictibacillus phosphorivorans]|uniref:ROK family protein n=1 Tax=Fictibacillus phosphorivorans TaxID=1221500 RepID=UPI0012CE2CD1|nr:ROK family protein [Fictibacillus phosphorivorans]MQR94728.1 ROK family protein [Fictibacillus phosphorivorans]